MRDAAVDCARRGNPTSCTAQITGDFNAQSLTGSATNIIGGVLDTSKTRSFLQTPEDYSGPLSSAKHGVTLSAPMQGTIHGNPAPKGILIDIDNTGTTGTITIDGTTSRSIAAIVGSK